MTTILPELERQLHGAAMRRTARRRTRRGPLLAIPALVAGAALVLAVVLVVRSGDPEREAPAGAVPAVSPLADAYAAFAAPGRVVAAPDPAALPLVVPPDAAATPTPTPAPGERQPAYPQRAEPALDLAQPVVAWTLRDRDGLRIEAWAGTATVGGARTTCFPHWRDGRPAGGDCVATGELELGAVHVIDARHEDARGYSTTLLVPDAVAGIEADGKAVPIEGNIALVRSPEPICSVRPVSAAVPEPELELDLAPVC